MALQGKVYLLDGLVIPTIVEKANLEELKDLALRDDDLWIVSYPKSGSTWTQYIVHLIHNGGIDDGMRINDAVPWLEAGAHDCSISVKDLIPPRAFKSHMPYERMPCGLPSATPCKYIYVARNPKDVATSFFYHYRAYRIPGMEWKEFIKSFLEGRLAFGNYFDHVLGWWSHKDDKNVLFIKYEDMKRDLVTVITQIATFMGYPNIPQETVREISQKVAFDKMRDNSTVNQSWTERHQGTPDFFRKGDIGDWRTHFSPEDSKHFDGIYQNQLRPAGLEFQF